MSRTGGMLALLATLCLTLVAPSAAAANEGGYVNHFIEARAFWSQATADECVTLNMYLGVREFTQQPTGPNTYPNRDVHAVAGMFLEPYDVCTGTSLGRSFGETQLGPADYAFDGLRSASLDEVAIQVVVGTERRTYTFDLDWVGNRDIAPFIVHSDRLLPAPGTKGGPGYRWNEHFVTAQVSGQVVADSGPQFTSGALWLAEIGQGTLIGNPRP